MRQAGIGRLVVWVMVLAIGIGGAQAATTGWNATGSGTYDYNDTNNWVDGIINGIWDISLDPGASHTVTFDTDSVLPYPLQFDYTGNYDLYIRGTGADRTLMLGGNITVDLASSKTVRFGSTATNNGLNLDMGGVPRTFTVVNNGRSLYIYNVVSNGTLTLTGKGALYLYGDEAAIRGNPVTVDDLTLYFHSGDDYVAGTTRLDGLTMGNTANLYLYHAGNDKASTTETIDGALTYSTGMQTITLRPDAAQHLQLNVDSLLRVNNGTLLVQGTGLGINALASPTAGAVNFDLTTPPTMVGAGGGMGSTTCNIILGAYGDTAYNGDGFNSGTGGLLTYDSTYGMRLLDNGTEYKSIFTDGQTQLDNVRLFNNSGTPVTSTINLATTVNSLSLYADTVSGSGIVVDGAGVLKINSGVIYALGRLPDTVTDGRIILATGGVDLNGREGIIMAYEKSLTSTRGGGYFEIACAISNDGGNGVTIGGPGLTRFGGAVSHTYTGATRVNSGILLLITSGGGTAIPGDLVVNGGAVEDAGDRIADTANITVNSGYFKLQIGNEGNSHSEMFSNLTMNGGSYGTGSPGHNGLSTINGTATLAGGSMNIVRYTRVVVNGLTTLSGATVSVAVWHDATHYTYLACDGGLTIVAPDEGAYTPITLAAGLSSYPPGSMRLDNNMTFIADAANANTVTISAPTGDYGIGVMALNGAQTFNIDDGPATTDLLLEPVLADNGATAGGIIKTGLGTLQLANASTYSGPTTVSAGTLRMDGSLTSAVTVGDNAVLSGTGNVTVAGTALTIQNGGSVAPGTDGGIGTLTVSGNAAFADGARLLLDVSGANKDLLAVSGNVTGNGVVEVVVSATDAELPLLVMTAANIEPTFAVSGLRMQKKNNNTELWLMKIVRGTVISIQ